MQDWIFSLRVRMARLIAPPGATVVPPLRRRPLPGMDIASRPSTPLRKTVKIVPRPRFGFDEHQLLITQCRDPLMWYAKKVGQFVPYVRNWPEGYASREDSGMINIVKFEDAVVVRKP